MATRVLYKIVRKKLPRNAGPNSRAIWLPVGQVVVFPGEDNKYHTGIVELNFTDVEFRLFHEDYNKEKQAEQPIKEGVDAKDLPFEPPY